MIDYKYTRRLCCIGAIGIWSNQLRQIGWANSQLAPLRTNSLKTLLMKVFVVRDGANSNYIQNKFKYIAYYERYWSCFAVK